jgi:GxxExxY protein
MTKWLYEKEMEQVIGLLYEARNEMGSGWSEEIYHQALVYLLKKANIPTKSKPRRGFMHRGAEIHIFEPDIIVWDKIILELKVLFEYKGKVFPERNQAQIIHYLKFYKMELGGLVNFAHPKVGFKRMIYHAPEMTIEEDYARMLPHVNENDKQILRDVQRHIKRLAQVYGLGYPEKLYRKLIAVELAYQGIACESDFNIRATLEEQVLGTEKTTFMLIENRFLLHVRSTLENIPSRNFVQMRTYLKAVGLKVGWLVNFGQKQLQIQATVPW